MAIPKITIEFFEDIYVEHVCDVVRLTREELGRKLEDNSSHSLNKKAENFITTYLRNDVENLTDGNWLSAKELFIQWKLFEGIELEEESEDKKRTLFELLDLFKQKIVSSDAGLDGGSKVAKIVVV